MTWSYGQKRQGEALHAQRNVFAATIPGHRPFSLGMPFRAWSNTIRGTKVTGARPENPATGA